MGGFFGCVSNKDCVNDLFYGIDYHSHLGTRRAGMAMVGPDGFRRRIHDISNAHFRSKFEDELPGFSGKAGIGVISDLEDQPLLSTSHLGTYAIVTVSFITNMKDLTDALFSVRRGHLAQTTGLGINPTEMISALIDTQETFEAGLEYVQEVVKGSCSLLILTEEGKIYAMRDRYGRTPVILGRNADGYAVAMETTAFPNLGYETYRDLGPGEITLLSADHEDIRALPRPDMRICAFFWIYYGFPSSSYEGINVEDARYRGGEALAMRSGVDADLVSGVPDSGVGSALGYSHKTGLPYKRPFVKYTPTWPRSFMPTDQSRRQLIANKKLVTIPSSAASGSSAATTPSSAAPRCATRRSASTTTAPAKSTCASPARRCSSAASSSSSRARTRRTSSSPAAPPRRSTAKTPTSANTSTPRARSTR